VRRWFGATGRRVPPIVVEGEHDLPLDQALVLEEIDLAAIRKAFDEGRPVVVRADTAEGVFDALSRPEVSCVLVPAEKRKLAEIDLVELTYGP
jgi:hypothetical protein